MQTIEIPLPDEFAILLERKARSEGLDRDTYIRTVLANEVQGTSEIDRILAPFREQVAKSDITDDELDHLFSEAREEVWRERQLRVG